MSIKHKNDHDSWPKICYAKKLKFKKKNTLLGSVKKQIKTKLIIIVKEKIAITTPATNLSLKHKKWSRPMKHGHFSD